MATTYRKPLYQKGDRGAEVALVQQYLAGTGIPVGAIDGVFGANTMAAVQAFQQRSGLPADGIVWQETFEALANAPVVQVQARPMPSGGTAPVMVMDPMEITGRVPGAPLPKWAWYAGAAAAAGLAYYFLVVKAGPNHTKQALAGLGHCGCDDEPPAPALARWKLPAHLRYRPPPEKKTRRK